jgi:hypothetical protein
MVRFFLTICVAILATTGALQASENVWSGLVLARNSDKPEPPPAQMHRIEETLRATFGYNQFQVIGQGNTTLVKGTENWTASSKHFELHVDAKGATNLGYGLRLQLFQDKALLLETDAKLSKSSPVVIKGPQIGDGQLLLLLVVQ